MKASDILTLVIQAIAAIAILIGELATIKR